MYALLLSISFSLSASVPIKNIQFVYLHLIKANYLFAAPALSFVNDNYENASCSFKGIELTTGMVRALQNSDEVARVLGHELGHYYLMHSGSTPTHEYEADYMAAKYMRGAGYNVCRGVKYLLRRNNSGDITHPSDYNRWLRFGCS